MKEYTWDDFWKDMEKFRAWFDSKPKWWRFRARRKWSKDNPLTKRARRRFDHEGVH